MIFRNDIQILRGLSVFFVVLYHLKIAGFSSGYLGVDVFFVISGFLMAKLYTPDDKAGFFLKRAKRLLPAYFAVIFLTVLASLFITVPSDFSQVKNQSYFALLLSSNIGFWMQNSYFENAAFNPLLHLWSLGVEIQFYLLVPLIFWLAQRSKPLYFIFLGGSLICCFFLVGISPKTAFFLTPFRLWQFLIGFAVARYYVTPDGMSRRTGVGLLGLIALCLAPFLNLNGESLSILNGHPGLAALAVSLATAAVLAFGIPKRVESNVLSRGLVKLGEYSYSIYLAHFPLIVLFLYRPFSGTVLSAESWADTLLLIMMIALASVALYRFIETPMRKSLWAFQYSFVAIIGTLLLLVGSGHLNKLQYTQQELNIFNATQDKSEYRCGKVFRILHPTEKICNLTQLNAPDTRVLLVGTSHADAIKTVFSEMAVERNIDVYFIVENTPLMGGGMGVDELLSEAKRLRVKHLVLHYLSQSLEPEVLSNLISKAKAYNISVALLMPVPRWNDNVPSKLYEHIKFKNSLPNKNIENYNAENLKLITFVEKTSIDNFKQYSTAEYFCNALKCKMANELYKPFYFDFHHLTLTGSRELQPVFDRVFNDFQD